MPLSSGIAVIGVCASAKMRQFAVLGWTQESEGAMTLQHIDNPDIPLDELMTLWPQTISVFLRHRMLCVGCMINPFHTVLDACAEYGLNVDAFYAELQQAVSP
jgi:hybrid cluster-associated redox disulfide protein